MLRQPFLHMQKGYYKVKNIQRNFLTLKLIERTMKLLSPIKNYDNLKYNVT